MSGRRIRRVGSIFLGSAAALAGPVAVAQDETASQAERLQEVVVVGTQIKGADPTGVLPVTVVDAEEIEAIAPTTGDELFRSIPQMGDVTFNESRMAGGINDARGDIASINLRALGTGNTLMLLNGRRMVLHPAIQVENLVPVATVNANTIPVLGVRRVEVLKDGAAAIYGTDAVAGVVNNVLKSSFEGLSLLYEAKQTEGTSMQEYDYALEWGRNFNEGRSNLSVFGSHTARDALWAREKPFARSSDNRALVEGTPFEGSTSFDNRTSDTMWAEFTRVNPVTYEVDTTPIRYTPPGGTQSLLTGSSTSLTSSGRNGTFHVQPTTNGSCVAELESDPRICFDNSTLSTVTADNNLRYNSNYERTLWSEVDRSNLFAFLNHQLEGGLELFGELGAYYSQSWGSREQDTPLATQRVFIPADSYWNPLGPVGSPNRLPGTLNSNTTGGAFPAGGVPLELRDYRPVDAGPQIVEVEQLVTRTLAGVRGGWRGWDWESALLYSRADTEDVMRSISMTAFQEALARTTPDAYNPFGGADPENPGEIPLALNPQSVIDGFIVPVTRASHTTMSMWDLRASKRDFFELPAGDVGIATGLEWRRETYGDDRDARLDGTISYEPLSGPGEAPLSDVMGVSPTPDTRGARNVGSAYLELAGPLVSPRMEIPLVHSLEAQVAVRFEDYSVFGSVTKPKVALGWQPVSSLQLRASWSEGFRAPNLPQLYERGILRNNGRTDWIRCEAARLQGFIENFTNCAAQDGVLGASVSVQSNRSGSESLVPEESENFTAGLVFQPAFLPPHLGRLTLTADYWRVEQTDIIGIFGDANHLTLDYLLRVQGGSNPFVLRADPTPAEIAYFEAAGLAPAGRVVQVIDNYRNLTPRDVEGLDLSIRYDLRNTPLGTFGLRLNAAKLLTFFQDPGPEQQQLLDAQAAGLIDSSINIVGAADLIRENGRPQWRGSGTLTWRKGNIGAGWYTSYVSEVNDTSASLADGTLWEVRSFLTHNVYMQYSFDTGALDGLRVRLGVRNVGDKGPPLADNDLGYIGDLHSPRGRVWYASLRMGF